MTARLAWCALASIAFAGACGTILSSDPEPSGTSPEGDASADSVLREDASVEDAPADVGADVRGCAYDAPFGKPQRLVQINSDVEQEVSLSLTADELAVYFARGSAAVATNLYVARRSDRAAAFGLPQPVDELNLPLVDDSHPALSADELRVAFARQVTPGDWDIYLGARTSGAVAFEVAALVTGGPIDFYPRLVGADALYFSSSRDGGSDYAIYRTSIQDASAPTRLVELDTAASEFAPVLSPDELTIWFSRVETLGAPEQVFVAHRASKSAPFGPAALVPDVNGGGRTIPGAISPDLCRLYLASDRGATFDLYVAERAP